MPIDTIQVFMIDPPWPKRKGGLRKVTPKQTRDLDYKTLPVPDIFTLLDQQILSRGSTEGHCVFMWTIDEFLWDAERALEARGYKRHARIIWNKLRGIAPAFTIRYAHEYLLWYYKPKLLKISEVERGKFSTVFEECSREHSRKPEFGYHMLERLYPTATKMDVFTRQRRKGWLPFGDEIERFT